MAEEIQILTQPGTEALVQNIKEHFSPIGHKHSAAEIGADPSGSATNALNSSKSYTNEKITDVQANIDEHIEDTSVHFTTTERTKLSGIASGAQVNSITGVKGNSESSYRTGNVNITKSDIGLSNVDNTSDANKPVSTKQQAAIDEALESAKSHTDTKFTNMVGSSSVSTQISNHNTSNSAHSDIRNLITELTTKLNQFLDVDDTTTDQLSEVLTLINNNKGTLESLTTSKINVSDIVDNLTTSSASKVLSAKQGVAIKSLIDTLQDAVNTKASSSNLTSHTGNTTVHITADERTKWNKAEVNQNAFGNVVVGTTTIVADSKTDSLTIDAGTGISVSGDATNDKVTITNSGVRSIATGTTNGTISVDTNGSSANVAVKGLGSAAYTASTAYAPASHTQTLSTISDVTATATELNYMDGVTSNVQTQLNSKLSKSGTAAKATADASGNTITSTYMTKENPTGTGSLSMNRKSGSTIGAHSVAVGRDNTASGDYGSFAEGWDNTASGVCSHAEGRSNTASGSDSHVEGYGNKASGGDSHAEGYSTEATEHAAHAQNRSTLASGKYSHAEGYNTIAASESQHVQGTYNIEDANGVYAHIVGNGVVSSDGSGRSNAHTLDWNGNAWFAGNIYSGGTSQSDATAVSLTGHKHSASDITSGKLSIARGGTGATTASAARTNLGIETGTWTPVLHGFAETTKVYGYYTKIGNLVTISFFINGVTQASSTTSNIYITGVPYLPSSNANWYGGGGHWQGGATYTVGLCFSGYVISNDGKLYPRVSGSIDSKELLAGYVTRELVGQTVYAAGTIMYPIDE